MASEPITSLIIGPVRFSYLNVFKPKKAYESEELEFSTTILIPKTPTGLCPEPQKILKQLADAIKDVAAANFGAATKGWRNCLKDGDLPTESGGEPPAPGYYYLRTKCKVEYPPLLIDGSRNKVTDGWKSGDWGMAKLRIYSYDKKSKGVNCGISAIQFLFHDDAIGGGGEASPDEFAVVPDAHKSDAAQAQSGGEYDPFLDQ